MSTLIDVAIDVTKMAPGYRHINGSCCLQGWVNVRMTGSPEGWTAERLVENRYLLDRAVTAAGHKAPGNPYGSTHYDYKVSDNTMEHPCGWPNMSEFADGSRAIMHMMENQNYSGVKEKLKSYESVGINFIPIGLPEETPTT